MQTAVGPQGSPTGIAAELGKQRPFDVPEQEAYLNLARTTALLRHALHRLLKPHGLTETTYNALRILRGHGGEGCRSTTIGDELVVPVPDVTRAVDRLVERGLATRERDPSDARAVRVRLTNLGRDLLAELDEPILDLHREQLGHLSREELETLNTLLVRAREPLVGG